MEVINFSDKFWQEIPDQDNPAYIYSDTKHQTRPEACLIIFRGRYVGITAGGIVVASVPVSGDITKLGVFWRLETAESFANNLATKGNNKIRDALNTARHLISDECSHMEIGHAVLIEIDDALAVNPTPK